jgi:hypothetical protein
MSMMMVSRRSRRKASRTIREVQVNKDIQLGSQNTIPKMLGSTKPLKISGSNAKSKGDIPILPHK